MPLTYLLVNENIVGGTKMYDYEEFLPKDEKLNVIKSEVSTLEKFFNNCFEKIFSCTCSMAERDYHVTSC
jgi:hypothetical protein